MRSEREIREELNKLYQGREWRKEHYWAVDQGMVIDGKLCLPKTMRIEFERVEERIETLEWVLKKRR